MADFYTIGVDFGTDSVRVVIADTSNGDEISSDVQYYPRWKKGLYCEPDKNQFRQHPLDYIESLEAAIKNSLNKAGDDIRKNIKGITIDTTGSTPGAVDAEGNPLALNKEFEDEPDAMFILWKDHTAIAEAEEINEKAAKWEKHNYLKYIGGVYSSEWFWAKIIHTLRKNKNIRENAYSWVEHCDWIAAELTGKTRPEEIKRSRCAAGHKAMWHSEWNGLPEEEFLIYLEPALKGLRSRLYTETFTSDTKAGNLSRKWAEKLGLNENVVIGVGGFDAHIGAVGAGIESFFLTKVIGTSTCDILTAPIEEYGDKFVKGICGQVDGSVIPDMLGMEAGQSAYGDVYAWFKNIIIWPVMNIKSNLTDAEKEKLTDEIIETLTKEAEKLNIKDSGVISIDWFNGRRSPFANQALQGAIMNLNLGSSAVDIFISLVEATAFGSKKIMERFIEEGIPINGVIALGGISKKSPYAMQVLANVLNKDIKVARYEHTCALGGAMFAAVVSGIYKNIEDAIKNMNQGYEKVYKPEKDKVELYNKKYKQYLKLCEFVENSTRNRI